MDAHNVFVGKLLGGDLHRTNKSHRRGKFGSGGSFLSDLGDSMTYGFNSVLQNAPMMILNKKFGSQGGSGFFDDLGDTFNSVLRSTAPMLPLMLL